MSDHNSETPWLIDLTFWLENSVEPRECSQFGLKNSKSVYNKVNIERIFNFQVATEETKIIEALNDFVENRISALPIVDSQVIGILKIVFN